MEKIFIAKSVDEAKQCAINEFAVDVSRITFEVIEEPKKSLFGKVKGDAKVKATYELTKLETALEYTKKILNEMGITDATFEVKEEDSNASVIIKSGSSSEIIGKKGEVLDSLQYLAALVANKGDKEYYRISFDIDNYREKRKLQLEKLAEKICYNVKKTGRSSALEPMNPYERRIIHAKVAEIEGVNSHSTGQDPYRKVIISSTVRRNDKKPTGNRGNKFNNNNNNRKKKEFDIKTSFEKDYKKPRPEDNLKSGLYSKIEF